MAADQKMTLRVVFTEGDIRKLSLNRRPTTVEDFISMLQLSLGLDYNFCLQYCDPEFNQELCNLTNIIDLPEKPTVKVIPLLELVPVSPASTLPLRSEDLSSDTPSAADREILSTSQNRQNRWPTCFNIPDFSVDVAYRLRQADLLYLRDGTHLKVSKELKHEILERLAESMYSYTAYSNNAQFDSVAKALIIKHPCLQEKGSASRCSGWKNSLKFKMANYRTKRRLSGCLDVTVNAGKRGGAPTEEPPAKKNIKKATKGELNYLPNFPDGLNQAALESARKDIVNEMQKRTPNGQLVKEKMELTFALRRKEVVDSVPAISEMLERWPALFTEDQVCMEFNRIVGKNLKQEFYGNIDKHSSSLINILRSKRGNIGHVLTELLQQTNNMLYQLCFVAYLCFSFYCSKTAEPTDIRTLVLRGLPVILGDKHKDFFKQGFDSDDDDSLCNIDIGILLVEPEGTVHNSSHLKPASLKIIIEEQVVMDKIEDLPKAMCLLFGFSYALHLNYPKSMKATFQFIQQVLLELGHNELKPKLQSLKNQLVM